jgi:hypothetical protein
MGAGATLVVGERARDVRTYQQRDLDPQAGTSPAGLTRGSIVFARLKGIFRKRMDCRVKPGNDDLTAGQARQ